MGLLDQVVDDRLVQTVVGNLQIDRDIEAFALVVLAEADTGMDLGIGADGGSRLAADQAKRAEVAGGVTGGEQLFGVGARAAVAAHFLGRGQVHVDLAVVGGGAAVGTTAAGCRCVGLVENVHEGAPYGGGSLEIVCPACRASAPTRWIRREAEVEEGS